MNKSELVTRIARRYPLLVAKDAEAAVHAILSAMVSALVDGGRVEIRGFGTFRVNYRLPRAGRNPKSGQVVPVPGKCVPHFKAARELRKRVDTRVDRYRQRSVSG